MLSEGREGPKAEAEVCTSSLVGRDDIRVRTILLGFSMTPANFLSLIPTKKLKMDKITQQTALGCISAATTGQNL